MTEYGDRSTVYFTLRDLCTILLLSVLAAISGAVVPSYLFPEDRVSVIVYGVLGLPGPGAGVFIFGSILCFWLLTGLILVGKPGTAAAMAVAIIAVDLLIGSQVVLVQVMDVLLIVALIIEAVCLFPIHRSRWRYVLSGSLAGLGLVTLAIALLGQAAHGEADLPVTGFPVIFVLAGILGLCGAVVCYRYPARYLLAAGLALVYYQLHFWLFWGEKFGSRFPPDPAMIPVLLLVSLLGGILSGTAAYGIGLLLDRYHGTAHYVQDQ
jgi:hypothetical protein